MVATTIEQSKHLVELGLDPNTADMYYTGHRSIYNPKEIEYTQEPRVRTKFVSFDRLEVFFPAWSLSALLEVMPPFIKGHHLKIEKTRITDMWYLDYQYLTDSEPRKDLLTAAYEMVCWLLENNLIKKGGQDDD